VKYMDYVRRHHGSTLVALILLDISSEANFSTTEIHALRKMALKTYSHD
jgi:hypothetical protein